MGTRSQTSAETPPFSSTVWADRLLTQHGLVTPSTASATTAVGDTTEVDRPASCEQVLTALLHAHEGTTEPIEPPTAGVLCRRGRENTV